VDPDDVDPRLISNSTKFADESKPASHSPPEPGFARREAHYDRNILIQRPVAGS
jgi:hypothetical protein